MENKEEELFSAGFIVGGCPLRNEEQDKQDSNTFARLVSDVASVSDLPSVESVGDLGCVDDDESDIAMEEDTYADEDTIVQDEDTDFEISDGDRKNLLASLEAVYNAVTEDRIVDKEDLNDAYDFICKHEIEFDIAKKFLIEKEPRFRSLNNASVDQLSVRAAKMLRQCLSHAPTGTYHSVGTPMSPPNDVPMPHAKREELLTFIGLQYVDRKRYFIEEGDPLPKVEVDDNHPRELVLIKDFLKDKEVELLQPESSERLHLMALLLLKQYLKPSMALPTDTKRTIIRTDVMKRSKRSAENMIKYHGKTKKVHSETFHIGQNVSIAIKKKQRKGSHPVRLPGIIVNKSDSAHPTYQVVVEAGTIKTRVSASQLMPFPFTPNVLNGNEGKLITLNEAGRLGCSCKAGSMTKTCSCKNH